MRGRVYLLGALGALIRLLPESRCHRLKAFLYNTVGGLEIHPTARVYSSVRFRTYPVRIGARTHVGPACVFDGAKGVLIDIEPDCDIAPEVGFFTGTHTIGPHARRAGAETGAAILVGAGTWIGARATVLPGVTIGAGCVVAAGSVVTKSCEADTLVAGVPATARRRLEG
jgi:maltose O-acetyltransferase